MCRALELARTEAFKDHNMKDAGMDVGADPVADALSDILAEFGWQVEREF